MNLTQEPDHRVGGRHGRLLGVALLANFALVCACKIIIGRPAEILWMSHVGLLLGGVGLITGSLPLVAAALNSVLVLHGLWLADCIIWAISGWFPLGITGYLDQAGPLTWAATVHHFYLVPVLGVLVYRSGRWPEAAYLLSVSLFTYLTVLCRMVTWPGDNINFAFGVQTNLDLPLTHWGNRLPGWAYLLGLNCFVSGLILGPPALLGVAWSRRRETNGRQARALPVVQVRPDSGPTNRNTSDLSKIQAGGLERLGNG